MIYAQTGAYVLITIAVLIYYPERPPTPPTLSEGVKEGVMTVGGNNNIINSNGNIVLLPNNNNGQKPEFDMWATLRDMRTLLKNRNFTLLVTIGIYIHILPLV